jgi:hypothetical protein
MNERPTILPAESYRASIEYISARWPLLPPHVREAIFTLVDAAMRRIPAADDNIEAGEKTTVTPGQERDVR